MVCSPGFVLEAEEIGLEPFSCRDVGRFPRGVGVVGGCRVGGGHFGEIVEDYADVAGLRGEGVFDCDVSAGVDVELLRAWLGVGAAGYVEGVECVLVDGVVFVAWAAGGPDAVFGGVGVS